MDIHPRAENQINTVCPHLKPSKGKKLFYQGLVKGTGQKGSGGQAKGLCPAVKAQAGRPVGTAAAGNTQSL